MWDFILEGARGNWLGFILPNQRIFVAYLVVALVMALGVHFYYNFIAKGEKPEGITEKGPIGYIFDKDVWWHKSARQDYLYFLVNGLIFFGLIAQLFLSFHVLVKFFELSFANIFGEGEQPFMQANLMTGIIYTIIVAVIIDFGVFFTHYLQHKLPVLWEFHKVHHSAEVLQPMTVYRMHPVDVFFTNLFTVLMLSLAFAGYFYLTGTEPADHKILGVNIVLFAFYLLGYNLRHSQVWLNYPKWLSAVLVSPAQHQIHHSSAEKHWDKNMGYIFSFWDKLFGTLYVPEKYEKLNYGINGPKPNPFNSVWDMYVQPFQKAWKILTKVPKGEKKGEKILFVSLMLLAGAGIYLGVYHITKTAFQPPIKTVHMEDLTWTEVHTALHDHGYNSVIIPTGGTEQNGPHVILGKHNYIIKHTAHDVAHRIGKTLVAPVVSYVPEGTIDGSDDIHMPYTGTLTLPEEYFARLLEWAARSYQHHGFTHIYFLGDSYGNQAPQEEIAQKLSKEWADDGVRVLSVSDYYKNNGQIDWLKEQGFSMEEIGGHAGIRDTSEMLFVHPEGVYTHKKNMTLPEGMLDYGFNGAPSKASAAIGKKMIDLKIDAAVKQIEAAR